MAKRKVKSKNKVKENFEIVKMNRKELKEAPYNPRKITDKHRKNLMGYIKKIGMLMPAINFNKRTGRLISGHQRLKIMDLINQTSDYEITVVVNDLTEKQEVEANVKLNSQNLMGEYDPVKLAEITMEFPEIDLVKDLAFEQEEIDLMFTELDLEVQTAYKEDSGVYSEYQQANMAKLKETKEKYRKRIEQENKEGGTIYTKDDDYTVTFLFKNNTAKKRFMTDIKQKQEEKYLPADILFAINRGEIKLSTGRGKKG